MFLGVWLAAIQLFWRLGIAFILHRHRMKPLRPKDGALARLDSAADVYGSVVMGIWFLVLAFFTFILTPLLVVSVFIG